MEVMDGIVNLHAPLGFMDVYVKFNVLAMPQNAIMLLAV